MTEAEWLACTDPTPMLEFLRGKASKRKLRLFACACCRQIWRFLRDGACQRAVEIGELYSDRKANSAKLRAAERDANRAVFFLSGEASITMQLSRYAAKDAALAAALCAAKEVNSNRVAAVARACIAATPDRPKDQCGLLRELFGPAPFRTLALPGISVLTWNDRTVPRLAQAAYDESHLPEGTLDTARLAILADALLDAGCDDEELMAHCRSEGPHVRGCWAVDLILGKE
jgi:hypothetical protein